MDIANFPGYVRPEQYQSIPLLPPSSRQRRLNHKILVLLNNFRIGLLDKVSDRPVMLGAAAALTALLAALAAIRLAVPDDGLWGFLLAGWFLLGAAYSMSVTPTGRLLRRSANPEDRPTLFAAQFALSHACWLIAYPLAGWLGAGAGQAAAFAGMAAIAACGTVLGALIWPRSDPDEVPHGHENLAPDHPHVREAHRSNAQGHTFVIDDLHPEWPRVP